MFETLARASVSAAQDAGGSAWAAVLALIAPALVFAVIAFAARGKASLTTAGAAAGEVRTNFILYGVDVLIFSPALALAVGGVGAAMQHVGLALLHQSDWRHLPPWLVGFLAIFAGDFIGYWRHRLEHTAPLWPAHAVHHSDERMTWTTLFRFHPINRLSTALIDTSVLALLGFPPWALVLNNLVRHYYGMFIHMDLPWTYGPLGRVLVSPAMHRWHHIRDANGAGVNFATVFSVFDQAFRTHHVPGPCDVPLGVRDDIGKGALLQLLHPFRVAYAWAARGFVRRREREPA
jgi:sterol desaturase/sphingolipid hydroxylase (fatty acid hydroxylase superfamily)